MKNFTTFIFLLIAIVAFAQAPEKYNSDIAAKKTDIFFDDFNDFSNYWLLGIEEDSWIENIEDGQLFFQSLTDKPKEDVLPVIIDQSRDFEIETSIKFVKGDMSKAYGLQWGKSQNPVKQFDFYLAANGQFTIDKYDGEFHDFVPFKAFDKVNRYAHNKLTVRKVADKYYFFINEILVHQMPFEPFFGNLLGVQVAERSTILVDYIRASYLGTGKGQTAKTKVLIMDYDFEAEAEEITVGTPVTLQVNLKNIGEAPVKNMELKFSFPEHVTKVDEQKITSLEPGKNEIASVQFYATKEFKGEKVLANLEIGGVDITNASDIKLELNLDKNEPEKVDKVMAQNYAQYRSSGDPLKGLNVAKAMKEVQVGEYYGLIIGIDNYSGEWKPLKNAVNDAKQIEKLLTEKYIFHKFKTLYNEKATRNNIMKEMEWLMKNTKPEDNVFIFYSGHGDYNEALGKGFWVPVNATEQSITQYVSNDDIKTFLSGIKSKHTLLVADACFSGNIFRGKTMTIPYQNSTKYYHKVYSLNSRKAISSGGNEPVMDGGKDGHSVFAYYFLKSLRTNTNKFYDAAQLFNDLKIPVVNNSEQTPNYNPVKNTGDEGGQFVFIKKD